MPNDLEKILADFRKFREDERAVLSLYSFAYPFADLANGYEEGGFNNRLDPKFYSPARKAIDSAILATKCAVPLREVVKFDREDIDPSENQFGSRYLDRITKGGVVEFSTMDGVHDPKLAKTQVFRAGDLVVSKIQLKNGIVGIVPKELDGIRATDEYYRLTPEKAKDGSDLVSRKYLRIALTSVPMRTLVRCTFTGQYGRVGPDDLGRFMVPIYPPATQEKIVEKYERRMEEVRATASESERKEIELLEEIASDIFGRG